MNEFMVRYSTYVSQGRDVTGNVLISNTNLAFHTIPTRSNNLTGS